MSTIQNPFLVVEERLEKIENILQELKAGFVVNDSSGKPEKLINIQEASAFLGIPVKSIYQKTRIGLLPFRKPGKRLQFSLKDLSEWQKK